MIHLRTARLTVLAFLLLAALVASCAAPAAAPAAEEAAAEAAPAEAAAGGSDVEAPPVNPAGQAPEATTVPGDSGGTSAPAAATGRRLFRIVPQQSAAQYAVEEEFFGQAVSFITAVGKTSAIAGEVTLDFDENGVALAENRFTVDISTLTSDRPRRDRAIREEWLESGKYPIATFVATEVADMPADAALGKEVAFTVAGDLTVREVTRPQTWAMTARVEDDLLSGQATTYLLMRDFGFEPPDIGGILKVTDGVTVTVDFVAREVVP